MTRILLTGATGYVGGRLLHQLVARGHRVRCLARTPGDLATRVPPGVEVVRGDVLDTESLRVAMAGMEAAYYLVHSMGDASGFEAREATGARHFAATARAAGLQRLIYLGGLGDPNQELSPHLRSRHEVGRLLRTSGVPTLELRASIVIGSGSLSFELVRALTEHLPVMITPRWVSVLAQPIAIGDLLEYLMQALEVPLDGSRVVEIGGRDRLSYLALMQEYARQRGLRRVMIPVPLLTPRLSSLWLGLVTPVYARVGRKLIESIRHPTIVTEDTADTIFHLRPSGAADAIRAALDNEDQAYAATRWSDARSAAGSPRGLDVERYGPRLVDRRAISVAAPPEASFAAVTGIGGRRGWPACNLLWRVRGFIDLLCGGVGMRRGRPEGRDLNAGDALDFWRVEAVEPNTRLRLAAEMRLPGRAWLEFGIEPAAAGSRIVQTATFDPVGLAGRLYWYSVLPLHALVFSRMLAGLARRATASATASQPARSRG